MDVGAVAVAAALHDIGKSPLLDGDGREHHELSALVLAAEGLPQLAEMARRHIVYAIRDPRLAPRTLEERVVYYADRRAGLEIVSIEERLREQAARFPDTAAEILTCLEPCLELERELFARLPFRPEDLHPARPFGPPLGPREAPQGPSGVGPLGPREAPQGPSGVGPLGPREAPQGPSGVGPLGPREAPQGPSGVGPEAPE